jgi:CRISPR-associated protein Cas2
MRVVAYDISDPKRLRKVAKICEKYLRRVQKSVFEGELTKSQLYALKNDLKKNIDKKEDTIIIYLIPRAYIKKRITLGKDIEDQYIIF